MADRWASVALAAQQKITSLSTAELRHENVVSVASFSLGLLSAVTLHLHRSFAGLALALVADFSAFVHATVQKLLAFLLALEGLLHRALKGFLGLSTATGSLDK